MDVKLIEKLYLKYIRKDGQGVKTDRQRILADYSDLTGEDISIHQLERVINKEIDRDKLWETHRGKLPIKAENGLHYDKRYIELDNEELYGEKDILMAHGYDPKIFTLINSGSTGSKIGARPSEQRPEDYFINTHRSVRVKLREFKLTREVMEELLESVNIEPIEIECEVDNGRGLLEIPLFDLHFGIATYDHYEPFQKEIMSVINERNWEEIVFVIGQDLLHNNDFKGHTSNLTRIERTDIHTAWEEVYKFYIPMIELALKKAKHVHVIYSKGNHDEMSSYGLVRALEQRYHVNKHITFDLEPTSMKHYVYKKVFLGYHHGDKINDKKLAKVFNAKYRVEMAKANYRIVKRGHKHHRKMVDDYGVDVVGVGSAAITDEWHAEEGFIGSNKTLELFVYNDNRLKEHKIIDGEK